MTDPKISLILLEDRIKHYNKVKVQKNIIVSLKMGKNTLNSLKLTHFPNVLTKVYIYRESNQNSDSDESDKSSDSE